MSSINQSTELVVAYFIKSRDQECTPLTPLSWTLEFDAMTKTTMAPETSVGLLKVSLPPFLPQLASSSLFTAWAHAYLIDWIQATAMPQLPGRREEYPESTTSLQEDSVMRVAPTQLHSVHSLGTSSSARYPVSGYFSHLIGIISPVVRFSWLK